jgi:hypothetical protein
LTAVAEAAYTAAAAAWEQGRARERREGMAAFRSRTRGITGLAVVVLVLTAGLYAVAQQLEESKRQRAVAVGGGTLHVLPATLETTQ